MKKLSKKLFILLISVTFVYALSWDDCLKKYEKAKQFTDNTELSYLYLKATKTCLVRFRNFLTLNPNPEFRLKSMNDNIIMLDNYLNDLIPSYRFSKNNLETIPKYLNLNSDKPIFNKEYRYFVRFKNCNGIHANNRIYTAKHCNIKNSKNIQDDLSYVESNTVSKLKIAKLKLNKKGTFKYYSMSKEGMFNKVLLQEKNCMFYKTKNTPVGMNINLDLSSLSKEYEIRSNCLAIPSNSGGGVFQDGKLVAIISKTVFDNNEFLYSVIEAILEDDN